MMIDQEDLAAVRARFPEARSAKRISSRDARRIISRAGRGGRSSSTVDLPDGRKLVLVTLAGAERWFLASPAAASRGTNKKAAAPEEQRPDWRTRVAAVSPVAGTKPFSRAGLPGTTVPPVVPAGTPGGVGPGKRRPR